MQLRNPDGLILPLSGPVLDPASAPEHLLTEEAALTAAPGDDPGIVLMVDEDQPVLQGAPVFRARHHPEIVAVAPMSGRVGSIDLVPGRRLGEVRLFRDESVGRHEYDTAGATTGEGLRALLLACGFWRAFRSRPFGRTPKPGERPSAIFVMGLDTRPEAPSARRSVSGREEDIARGLAALSNLTTGAIWVCLAAGDDDLPEAAGSQVRKVRIRPIHPWGQAGFVIHTHHPATLENPVWDIHLEDVAGIGALLATGLLDETRVVSVAGGALTSARLVRCQPGADLRRLAYGYEKPGTHEVLTGSLLEGRRSRWLGPRDRQVSVIEPGPRAGQPHWLRRALQSAARPLPIIPSAALDKAMGGAFPAAHILRALAVGDRESAIRLGALSLVGEDLSLADYVTCATPLLSAALSKMLSDMATEEDA